MNNVLEVSKSAFKHNIDVISKYVNYKKIMPIIKANGYGTYINKNLELIKDFNIVGVARVSEAIELRNIGFKNEIFVLNQPYVEEIGDISKYNISIGICSFDFLLKLIESGKKVKVHLEIESGMNRTGIKESELDEFVSLIKNSSNILVDGIYTHFSSADSDKRYTLKQIDIFDRCVMKLKDTFKFSYIHSSASNGVLHFNDEVCNTVRVGILMYGYINTNLDVKPICKLKSRISFIKEIDKNESVSYNRTFKSKTKMKIATVGIGYADGVRRELSNKGFVLVNGVKCPIVGNICMDSLMIDVSDVDVQEGDFVYIFDNENIRVSDISSVCNTIDYEILSSISTRVERVFVK